MKKHIKKWGAWLCAAVMLLVSVPAVPVQATSVDIDYFGVDPKKIADIILTKQGVVASEDVLEEVVDDWVTGLSDVLTSTVDLVTFNSTDACDRETFEDNLDVAGVTGYEREVLLNAYDVYCTDGTYSWLDKAENYDSMVTNGLKRYLCEDAEHDGEGIRRGTTYTVPEDAVEDVCNTFQTWWSQNSDYIIYRVPGISEIPVSWFPEKALYDSCIAFFESANEGIYYLSLNNSSYTYNYSSLYYNELDHLYYSSDDVSLLDNFGSMSSNEFGMKIYDYCDWVSTYHFRRLLSKDTSSVQIDCIFSEGTNYEYDHEYFFEYSYYYNTPKGANEFLVSNVARNIKIFRKIASLKEYDCGQQPVYFSPTYDSSVTNTVTYTGDYYCDNSGVYNYGTVQDSINNIDGDVTDSIVDSVVDESVTNITNNYYYGTGSGDGGSSGDDDSKGGIFERLLDAIGNVLGDLLGLLEEIVDLFLSAIVEAIGVIIQGLTGAIAKLRELSIQVEGVTGFLSEFFGFVPVDYWDMITSVMLIALVVAVIRIFKK